MVCPSSRHPTSRLTEKTAQHHPKNDPDQHAECDIERIGDRAEVIRQESDGQLVPTYSAYKGQKQP
jgi:hypothetical protein